MKEVQYFPKGLTVRELKEMIKDWPEEDEFGNESEVWIETSDGLSNLVTSVWPLNSTDILFENE